MPEPAGTNVRLGGYIEANPDLQLDEVHKQYKDDVPRFVFHNSFDAEIS